MKEFAFRETTLVYLKTAGWKPGRTIRVQAFEKALKKEGHPFHPVALKFLAEFGKLDIEYDYGEGFMRDTLHLDPILSVSILNKKVSQKYSARVGAPVCPIGAYNYQHDKLMMTPDGKVYGGYDQFLDLVGHSGEEAIDNILRGKDMWYEQIP